MFFDYYISFIIYYTVIWSQYIYQLLAAGLGSHLREQSDTNAWFSQIALKFNDFT